MRWGVIGENIIQYIIPILLVWIEVIHMWSLPIQMAEEKHNTIHNSNTSKNKGAKVAFSIPERRRQNITQYIIPIFRVCEVEE